MWKISVLLTFLATWRAQEYGKTVWAWWYIRWGVTACQSWIQPWVKIINYLNTVTKSLDTFWSKKIGGTLPFLINIKQIFNIVFSQAVLCTSMFGLVGPPPLPPSPQAPCLWLWPTPTHYSPDDTCSYVYVAESGFFLSGTGADLILTLCSPLIQLLK